MKPRSRTGPVVAVVAALAAVGGLVVPAALGLNDTTAKDRIAADPPPALFPAAVATGHVSPLVDPEAAEAHRSMRRWWLAHGTTPDDAAFATWMVDTFPGPPSAADRKAEMTQVERLDARRTDAGVSAATWLEAYGKKDVWKLAAHDQAELLPGGAGDDRKNTVDAILSMTKDVADRLGTKFQQSAPYVLEPSLRTDHTVVAGQVCPCSYPSRHASAAAASRTYLGHLMPERTSDYRYLESEVDWSRIYMAGHVASDIRGGALLGDMVGEYYLVTTGAATPQQLAPVGQR